jgi:hypothetical protein
MAAESFFVAVNMDGDFLACGAGQALRSGLRLRLHGNRQGNPHLWGSVIPIFVNRETSISREILSGNTPPERQEHGCQWSKTLGGLAQQGLVPCFERWLH